MSNAQMSLADLQVKLAVLEALPPLPPRSGGSHDIARFHHEEKKWILEKESLEREIALRGFVGGLAQAAAAVAAPDVVSRAEMSALEARFDILEQRLRRLEQNQNTE